MRGEKTLVSRDGPHAEEPRREPGRLEARTPAPLIHLKNATAGYGGRAALRGIDLTIYAGERVALMGRSGAGKSTLVNLIHRELGGQVALAPQASALVDALSVFHNVYMGRLDRRSTLRNLWTLVRPAQADVAAVRETLALVELEAELFSKAGALSGGQRQRVSVARALYDGRPVIVADEPVSALDRRQGAAILARIAERSETTILVLHDAPLALDHVDRIVVLDDGRIVLDQPSRALSAADLAPFFEA
ncbi:ATP-binding cassette domain-containing protein [Hansschlegelia quercus]|uniref:ATP-binding cassette domain-containing protein n=1 Tax=Hansschlegelia quercus TaxID=2528245 RepID=A0A4Q9G9P1_9HYPH|nr:ATP-binding cassette domain-containing protein [Hansschlegelia quercus]TBN47597.1 ATP-binding cassette domain-containing protein [Hansschlegelia quercus]